ncbi:MAG TPA: ABC transporter permease, partial [Acidimicrobiales bacterium]
SFNGLFASVYQGTDVQVRGAEKFNFDFTPVREPFDESLAFRVAAVPGVKAVVPGVQGYSVILGHDGQPVGSSFGPPRYGGSWGGDGPSNPFRLSSGRAPTGPDEVVIDRGSARSGHLHLGDRVRIQGKHLRSYTLVGIARFGATDSPLGATYALWTLTTAQSQVGTAGRIDTVAVVGDRGVSQAELKARIGQAIAFTPTEVITRDQLLHDSRQQVQGIADSFNRILSIFAAIALFVSSFVIFNTFSVLIAQRTRELAMLRAVGATGTQVLTSVILEAFTVGLVASVLGVGFGVGMFFGLKALFGSIGLDLPLQHPVLEPHTVVAALLVGGLITTVSAAVPAVRAARVPPVAALRDVALDRSGRSRVRSLLGLLVVVVGLWALASGLSGHGSLGTVGGGMAATLVGVIVLGPVLVRPLARSLGAPLARLGGISGALAQENAVRNPGRTASTASALMIGVALVTFVTVFAGSLVASNNRQIDRQFQGDFTVTAGGAGAGGGDRGGLPTDLAGKLARTPGVAAATPVRQGIARVGTQNELLYGVDGAALSRIVAVAVTQGSLSDLGTDGIAVRQKVAARQGWGIGTRLTVTQPRGPVRRFTVKAIFDSDNLTGPSTAARFVVGLSAFAAGQVSNFDQQILIKLRPGISPAAGRPAIERTLRPYGLADLLDKAQFKSAQSHQIDLVLALIYGLLALAVVIAILGIGNTLSLSALERT